MNSLGNLVDEDDSCPPLLLDSDGNGLNDQDRHWLPEGDDDDDDDEKESKGPLPLLGQTELDKLKPKKQYSLMELQEFSKSSSHHYPYDLIYTRMSAGASGVPVVQVFLRQGKPTPQKETFKRLLAHEVQASPSIFPTKSQVVAVLEKKDKYKRRRMAPQDIAALAYATNFGTLYSIRSNLVVKYLKKANLTGKVYGKYLERQAAEMERPPSAADAPIEKVTRSILAPSMEDSVDYDEADEETYIQYQDNLRLGESRLGGYYYSDIVAWATKGVRQGKVVRCIHQKFVCTAKLVNDCLDFLTTVSVGRTMLAQSMHSRAMNICRMVLDEVDPFLTESSTPLLPDKSDCYLLFCSLTKDLVMLDEAIAKLGLTPDELARAPAPVALAAGYKKFPENTHAVTQRLQKRAAQIERLEGRLKCLVKMESPPIQLDEAKENLVATKRLFQDVRRRAERIEESYPVSVWEEDPSQWEHEMSPLMTTLKIVDEDMTDLRHWCDRHQTW